MRQGIMKFVLEERNPVSAYAAGAVSAVVLVRNTDPRARSYGISWTTFQVVNRFRPRAWDEKSHDPSNPRIRCPLCGWSPRKEDKWFCTCGFEWNTSDMGALALSYVADPEGNQVEWSATMTTCKGRVFMSINPIPAGFHTIAPNIIVKSVDEAVSFYKQAFGAEEVLRLSTPDGKVVHCELKFGDSRVNLGEAMEGWPEHTLLAQIFVADSDAVFARAVEAGAKVLSPMTDMFFGSREGRVLDPFGSTWTISTHKENVSVEEMQQRLNALAAWRTNFNTRINHVANDDEDCSRPVEIAETLNRLFSQHYDRRWTDAKGSSLIATIRKKLPEFAKACADDAELVLLHQDAFAADYQEDEHMLLCMAIKYAGLRGKEVRVIGKNGSTLGEEDSIHWNCAIPIMACRK